jgi:hypothetical protein
MEYYFQPLPALLGLLALWNYFMIGIRVWQFVVVVVVYYSRRGNIEGKRYCIIVKRKGVGGAKDCSGEIKVEGIDTDYYTTLWYKEDNPSITITMDEKYLNLFEVIEIDNQKQIRFFPYQKQPSDIPYNEDNINKSINVRVGSTNAQKPRDYSKKLSEIINL